MTVVTDTKTWLHVPATESVYHQGVVYLDKLTFGGETFCAEATFRSGTPGFATTARIIIRDALDNTRLNTTYTQWLPAGTTGTLMRRMFTLPKDTTNLTVFFGRNGGAAIDVTDCRIYKV